MQPFDPVDLTRTSQRIILASYFVFLLLCLPVWWALTSLDRNALPEDLLDDLVMNRREFIVPLPLRWHGSQLAPAAVLATLNAAAEAVAPRLSFTPRPALKDDEGNIIPALSYTFLPTFVVYGPSDGGNHDNADYVPSVRIHTGELPPHALRRSNTKILLDEAGDIHILASSESKAAQLLGQLYKRLLLKLTEMPDSIHFDKRSEILLSLLVEEPEEYPNFSTTWAAQEATRSYIEPFLDIVLGDAAANTLDDGDETKPTPYFVNSQIQYYAKPSDAYIAAVAKAPPQRSEPLPLHLFRNSDWNLASTTQNTSTIHLVFFMMSRKTQRTTTPGIEFVVPRWGGISLEAMIDGKVLLPMDTEALAARAISHLRSVLGVMPLVGDNVALGESVVVAPTGRGIAMLEAFLHRVQRTAIDAAHAGATLESLRRLLRHQTTLPVGQEIVDLVRESMQNYHVARMLGPRARAAARSARAAADDAFFHSGMVGMLYFPNEHKYAIYMPFFLPVLLALARAAVSEINVVRRERALRARIGKIK